MALLLAHSHYSQLTAPCSPRELCEEALRLGHDHLLLCDLNGLYGFMDFAREARRLGLQALYGVELVQGAQRLWALARDRQGYRSLCRLVTGLQLEEDFSLLRGACEHQAGLSFMATDALLLRELAGELPSEDLYVPLIPAGLRLQESLPSSRPIRARKLPDPCPWPERRELLRIAGDLHLPLIAVFDIWYACPEEHDAQRLFLASKHNSSLQGLHLELAEQAQLPDRLGLAEGHADFPRAQENAQRLRERCELEFTAAASAVFPEYQLPDGTAPALHLRRLAEAGLQSRYADADEGAKARLQQELLVIEAMGFVPYFLVVREIAELARERGIDYVGRGSAADSLVAYCLGLTDADPIRYGLLFARFLNPARENDRPDIDLDFCWRRRDELLELVYEHFGHDRVAMIATFNTCGPRAAYVEAAKVMGLPPQEVHRRSRLLPYSKLEQAGSGAFARCIDAIPGFYGRGERAFPRDDQREARILVAADKLLRAPRHLGVHPGGIVLSPGPIVDYVPLERAAKGLVVTQYDMHFVEDLGLVKIDLLGNRAITVLQDSLERLTSQGLEAPDLLSIPEDDAKTSRLLRQGRSLGCFQTESPAVRSLLRQMDADDMDRVIQAVALIRPGPSASGMKDRFIRRLRGIEPVSVAHPILAEVFADTFGVMLYQEDVIRAAMTVGEYSPEDGDRLRRHLGKVVDGDMEHREAFLVAGLRRGLTAEAVAQVWGEMARFAGYSFCKAHAVTYGRIAYRCVYMKAHYPAAYLAAMLSNDAGYYEKGVYVEEARRMGISLLHPCVQVGACEYRAEGPAAIRVGLMDVRKLTEKTKEGILEARRLGGPFADLDDFLARSGAGKEETRKLILCGACDALSGTRPELLWRLEVAGKRSRSEPSGELIPGALDPPQLGFPQLPEYGEKRRAQLELEILGFCLQAHPMDVLWDGAAGQGQIPLGRIEGMIGRQLRVCGWIVAMRRHRNQAGQKMLFLTLEDGTGILEVVLFPDVYPRLAPLIEGRGPYLMRGRVEGKWGSLSMRAQDLVSLAKKARDGVAERPGLSLD